MCREIGHTFGLGHTSEDGSSQNTCMDYFSNTGTAATSTASTHPKRARLRPAGGHLQPHRQHEHAGLVPSPAGAGAPAGCIG